MQNNLGEGGFTGITLILYFLWGINPGLSNMLLNIPLFFIAWRIFGKRTFIYTIIGTIFVSLTLYLFQLKPFQLNLSSDMTLVALFAGVFIGIGLGFIFRVGATTGGIDIIARILQKYFGISIGKTMLIFDICVITLSMFLVLDLVQGMYTLVSVYIAARIIDFIQEGAYSARGAWIISTVPKELSHKIMTEMNRGVTIFQAEGSYTKEKREVLYCVVGKKELYRLKHLIKEIDPTAFVTLTSVNEVIGEGFSLDEQNKPTKKHHKL